MSRNEIYRDIKETLGIVPTFFKNIPEDSLEEEWTLFKKLELEDGPIPQKYRALMGLALHAFSKCRYCTYFHLEAARLMGATEEEIQAAVHYSKHSTGWSTYLNGFQLDFDEFRNEVQQILEHVRSTQEAAV